MNWWEYSSKGAHTFLLVRDEEPITKRYRLSAGQKYHCQPVTVCEIESRKKNVRTQWQIILYLSNLLRCAGADRRSPVCQVPHGNICEHADQLRFASVFQRCRTSCTSEIFFENSFCASPTSRTNSGRGLHFSKQTFYLRILVLTLQVLLCSRCTGCIKSIYNFLFHRKKYGFKSHENLLVHLAFGGLLSLISQRSHPNLTFC